LATVEKDFDVVAFDSYFDRAPSSGCDSAVNMLSNDTLPILVCASAFDGVLPVIPTADIRPRKNFGTLHTEQYQETFFSAGFSGFECELVILPVGIAKNESLVFVSGLLCDDIIFDCPCSAVVVFEGAIPNEFAPQSAVDGVVDVFEKMRIDFLIDSVEFLLRLEREGYVHCASGCHDCSD